MIVDFFLLNFSESTIITSSEEIETLSTTKKCNKDCPSSKYYAVCVSNRRIPTVIFA